MNTRVSLNVRRLRSLCGALLDGTKILKAKLIKCIYERNGLLFTLHPKVSLLCDGQKKKLHTDMK